jgi:hypothetical protein
MSEWQIVTISSVIGGALGWVGNLILNKFSENQRKNTEQQLYISRLQLEHEIESYKAIWSELVELSSLIQSFEQNRRDGKSQNVKSSKLDKQYNTFKHALHRSEPFLHQPVFKAFESARGFSWRLLRGEFTKESNDQGGLTALELLDQMQGATDLASEEIRKRILITDDQFGRK